MGGWKKVPLSVYVVAWPDGTFKVGVSAKQRWRRFVLRNAELIYLAETPDAYAVETSIHERLRALARRAFDKPEEAIPYLGDTGGYLECYRPMLEQCPSNAQAHAQALPFEQCTYGRTDVLTKNLLNSQRNSRLSDARTRAEIEGV